MSRILLPTPDAPPKRGGVARYIAATLRARIDVELDVLPERLGTIGIFLRFMERVGKSLKGDGIFQIWTHHIVPVGTTCYVLSLFGARVHDFPLAYTVFLHGLDFDLVRRNAWKRFLAKRILRRARHVVTNSVALQKEVAAFVGRGDVRVVYPCVSQELVDASLRIRKGLVHRTPEELAKLFASALATTVGIGISSSQHAVSEPVRLLTVARLVQRKGHAKVLQVLKDVPDVLYTMVGDGPELETLRALARSLGLEDRVSFLTEVNDEQLPELYAAHDIFVMPTTRSQYDREGFGIVYAEAGLFGLPCVATDIPGVDEVVERDVTGLLVQDTPDALRDALQKLIASPRLRSRLGTAARARVLARFTEARFAESIRSL